MIKSLDIHLPAGMRTATPRDWREVGSVIADAFAEDPVNLWIFGKFDPMPAVFSTLARNVYLARGLCHLSGSPDSYTGATMWSHSSANRELGPLATLGLVSAVMRRGAKGAAKRGLTAAETMAREHPKAPHIYLFAIGTRKAARGKGLGKTLISPVLDAADRAGLPCYLENSNPANTGFYRSRGFERMKLFEPGPGAPPMEAMWREPRAVTGA